MKHHLTCTAPECFEPHKAKGLCSGHYYRQRDISRAAKAAAGQRCHYCRQPSEGKYTCSNCAKKKSARERDRRALADSKGLCQYSGCPELQADGKRLCRQHQDYHEVYYASHKNDRPQQTPERRTVGAHLGWINRGVSTYAGMPFCDDWNPKKGGSVNAGEQWIVQHLGRRPAPDYQLHIVDRRIGFMPGNLVWVPRDKHRREEMIYRLLFEVQTLRNLLDKS
jgi:hypothetical protein